MVDAKASSQRTSLNETDDPHQRLLNAVFWFAPTSLPAKAITQG